ncbi:threonine--tRNA ligase 1, cytoplasmic-like isoform X2 [Pristis pectinata]|uniref:threonine--tRNA ligase 1, cytoplasmic-like isoform X2 n=1 Tax=Pristis pectinata TaxID=685728 RepID=UPI00223DDF1A|nr:threonine--tRNA ligase 1, cytoplasmic-like isoform X2 [Pristis pectinata]
MAVAGWSLPTRSWRLSRVFSVSEVRLRRCWNSAETAPWNDRTGRPAGTHGEDGGGLQVKAWPEYIEERLQRFEKLKETHDKILQERVSKESRPIKVWLPDGKCMQGESWKTSPYQISRAISRSLAEGAVVARVNGALWDLHRPLEGDADVELLQFGSEAANAVYWHSSAHVLGAAMEQLYGGLLCRGPNTECGFFYDMYLEGRPIPRSDFPQLERICRSMVKERLRFERVEVRREDLLELFEYNKFKLRFIEDKVTSPMATVYRCGSLVDLCRGPHIRHTGQIKAFRIEKSVAVHWAGNSDMEPLHRIHGISFPDNKALTEWDRLQEEARNRDHRKIGKEQELFFFHELSPGSCFFLPKGAHIYNTLTDFLKREYRKRGFVEVVTPNVFNSKLWELSGHWDHYSENMFSFKLENETYALKPMNCPGHCLMYDHRPRSWRELPLRLADFGVLHRNEFSGALSGLVRARRFQQDDAHIFCTLEQIEEEIKGCLDFLQAVYQVFGFTFCLYLSTRPEKFLGDVAIWDQAEKQLEKSLKDFGRPWERNPGDGAFYGPKIDIQIKDAIGRNHQCATIQLDFQLPVRFGLSYVGKDGGNTERPVMIHRAILGSVERMIAILAENCAGKWPFWLSPSQVMVIPLGHSTEDYAHQVHQQLLEAGFMADISLDPGSTLNRKIRNAQLAQYNFILVVGEKERSSGTVSVRTRDNRQHGMRDLSDTVRRLTELKEQRCRNAEEEF